MTNYIMGCYPDGGPEYVVTAADNSQNLHVFPMPVGQAAIGPMGNQCGWDGVDTLYAIDRVSGGTYGLWKCKPLAFAGWTRCAKGAVFGNTNSTQNYGIVFDGAYIWIYFMQGIFMRYYPFSDEIVTLANPDPLNRYSYGIMYWDGDSTLFITGAADHYTASVPYYSRYDTKTNTLETYLTQDLIEFEDKCIGQYYAAGLHYRVVFINGVIYMGVATENTAPHSLNFVYQATGLALANFVNANFFCCGWPQDLTHVMIVQGQNIWQCRIDSSNEIDLITSLGSFAEGFAAGAAYDFVPLAQLVHPDGTPVANDGKFITSNIIAGLPTNPVPLYCQVLSNTAHIYIIPVVTSGPIAQYVQVALTPQGPWESEIDLGAGITGQLLLFYCRIFTPFGYLPATYNFTLEASATI